jgi:type I restriction enzyme S subunit
VNQHVALVRPKTHAINSRFLAYALRSEVGRSQFKSSEYGGTKQGLGLGDVKAVFVPVPRADEQCRIVARLDKDLALFDTAIARTEREIALLQEYRTRLTADVVTGKVDVRDAAARLPELPADSAAEPLADEPMEEMDEAEEA